MAELKMFWIKGDACHKVNGTMPPEWKDLSSLSFAFFREGSDDEEKIEQVFLFPEEQPHDVVILGMAVHGQRKYSSKWIGGGGIDRNKGVSFGAESCIRLFNTDRPETQEQARVQKVLTDALRNLQFLT